MGSSNETRITIIQAALDLAKKNQGLTNVALEHLIKSAGVSRATFYRYFSSLSDIPIFLMKTASRIGYHQIGRTLPCEEGHLISLGIIENVHPLFSHLVRPWEPDFTLSCVTEDVTVMRATLKMYGVPITNKEKYKTYMLAFAIYEAAALWVMDREGISLQQLVSLVCDFYPDDYRRIFDGKTKQATYLSEPAPKQLTEDKFILARLGIDV